MADRQGKTVKFRKDSATGSSRSSHGHRRSDSGVGSFSDQSGHEAYPDRTFTAQDVEDQSYSIAALQEALKSALRERDHYKLKAQEIDSELSDTKKKLRESEASWRGLVDRNHVLEDDKAKMQKEKKQLVDENELLRLDLDRAYASIDKLASQSTVMSGAMPEPGERSGPRRSSSKREKDAEKEKAKLAKRFERSSDDGDVYDSTTSKPPRSRRMSSAYIEPLGPGAPKHVGVAPPSPSRVFTSYTTAPMHSPTYAPVREPAYSNVPRSIHPVVIYDENAASGDYQNFPLPDRKSKERR